MKAKPILFSGEMVLAILEGRKTMTRRVVKPQPDSHHWEFINGHKLRSEIFETSRGYCARFQHTLNGVGDEPLWVKSPCGGPGAMLYVRETWAVADGWDNVSPSKISPETHVCYCNTTSWREPRYKGRNRPSIHMPKWASRLTLKVTNIRVERLQDISAADVRLEGISCPEHDFPGGFCTGSCSSLANEWVRLWESINGKQRKDGIDISWDANPLVWVISFEPILKNVDVVLEEGK